MAPACPAWDSFIELRVGRSSLGDSPPFQPAQPHSAEPTDTHVMQYMAALSCSPSWSLLRAWPRVRLQRRKEHWPCGWVQFHTVTSAHVYHRGLLSGPRVKVCHL